MRRHNIPHGPQPQCTEYRTVPASPPVLVTCGTCLSTGPRQSVLECLRIQYGAVQYWPYMILPFCGAGIWILSQDWQLYSQTNSVCDIHSQFCQNAPQVQNEFPLQTPISERAVPALQSDPRVCCTMIPVPVPVVL